MNKKTVLIGAVVIVVIAAVITAIAVFGNGKKEQTELPRKDMPENIIDFNNKAGEDFIPVDGVEEHGNVAEAGEEDLALPSEDELGEYKEIFMDGDIIDENTMGGWVVEVSLKDITINTYNTLTTYILSDAVKSTADRLKPGDAVMLVFDEDENGEKVLRELGRVRVEDEPLTNEEIIDMQNGAE